MLHPEKLTEIQSMFSAEICIVFIFLLYFFEIRKKEKISGNKLYSTSLSSFWMYFSLLVFNFLSFLLHTMPKVLISDSTAYYFNQNKLGFFPEFYPFNTRNKSYFYGLLQECNWFNSGNCQVVILERLFGLWTFLPSFPLK